MNFKIYYNFSFFFKINDNIQLDRFFALFPLTLRLVGCCCREFSFGLWFYYCIRWSVYYDPIWCAPACPMFEYWAGTIGGWFMFTMIFRCGY